MGFDQDHLQSITCIWVSAFTNNHLIINLLPIYSHHPNTSTYYHIIMQNNGHSLYQCLHLDPPTCTCTYSAGGLGSHIITLIGMLLPTKELLVPYCHATVGTSNGPFQAKTFSPISPNIIMASDQVWHIKDLVDKIFNMSHLRSSIDQHDHKNVAEKNIIIHSNLPWEATTFALWTWPQKTDGLKLEVAFIVKLPQNVLAKWP